MEIIGPKSPFQEKYLNSDARIMVVGGAAGSSKSYCGLMRHLRWVHDPAYRGFCIRKNSTAIMKTGGLFDEAVHLYSQVDPKIKPKLKDQRIIFSSGGEVAFSHYENRNAAQLYQGLQISGILYDEASHAMEEDIWWLISRLRTRAKMTPSIWLTCNPDPDSYLFNWIEDYYLYPEGHELAGRPIPERNGDIRWLLRREGNIIFSNSKQELVDRYGENINPLSFQGLFGTIDDNPTLQEMQPEYKHNLDALPRVENERLRWGNWRVRPESSGFWRRTWCPEVQKPYPRSEVVKTCRAWDLAGSLPSETNPDVDFSVGVKMDLLKSGDYVITDVIRFRARYGEVERKILQVAYEDGKNVDIVVPRDPGAAGLAAAKMLAKAITGEGFYCRMKPTNKSKVERFRPFASASENGLVQVVSRCCADDWNKTNHDNSWYYNELESFDGSKRGHDDAVDATADAFEYLATSKKIPIGFKLPSFTEVNPFAFN